MVDIVLCMFICAVLENIVAALNILCLLGIIMNRNKIFALFA